MDGHSPGYPWDNPSLYVAEEMSKRIEPCKQKKEPESITLKELVVLNRYKDAYEEIEAYWLSYAKNLWSLLPKKPRSQHQERLKEIYLVEAFVKMMQDKKVI